MPVGFGATEVIRCVGQDRTNPDGSQDWVMVERVTSDAKLVARLVAALSLPDSPPSQGGCSAVGHVYPPMVVLDPTGRWVSPPLPMGPCGGMRPEVAAAVKALPELTTATSIVRQLLSTDAAVAGCSQHSTDMIHLLMLSGDWLTGPFTKDPFPAAGSLRVCEYQVSSAELGQQKPSGEFTAGKVITGADRVRLGEQLAHAPAATPCTTEATRFAAITTVSQDEPVVYVELDGCHRQLADTGGSTPAQGTGLAQVPAALLDALRLQ